MASEEHEPISDFYALTPDVVIGIVEKELGRPLTNLCRSLNSYINRVFELKLESGEGVIAKFYRPGRWSRAALQDEHDFLFELDAQEIPVIPPLRLESGESIGEHHGTYFTTFPKKLGRGLDEPSYDEWEQLGRLLARVHAIGALHPPRDRITMTPDRSTRANLAYILEKRVVPADLRDEYERTVMGVIDQITPMFDGVELLRIHGDCHAANIVYRPGESFYLIDFDDMAVGPAMQDLWMLLPDYSKGSLVEIDMFLEGYSTFRDIDRRTLRLIEPLRAMRFIHFTAWCAVQAADGGFSRLAPGWGTREYWQQEIRDLKLQQEEIVAARDHFSGGMGNYEF